MSPELKDCEASALRLTAPERAALAERLIESLDELDDMESERLWVREANRRYEAFIKGEISARPEGCVNCIGRITSSSATLLLG